MQTSTKLSIAIALAAGLTTQTAWAQQQTVTVGSIQLTMPAGWKATATADGSTQIMPATGRS